MKENNIGRFDFCNYKFIDSSENILYKDYILVKNNDINNFIYNVGTALYNTEKYINLLSNFDYEYREFELQHSVQEYALNNMNCYYINYMTFKFNFLMYFIWIISIKPFQYIYMTIFRCKINSL